METYYEQCDSRFPVDCSAIYGNTAVKCWTEDYHKREENVTIHRPRGGCPSNSIGDLFEKEHGHARSMECWSLNCIRRTQEQGMFGDNMEIEEFNEVWECRGLLAKTTDENGNISISCRTKIL